MRTRWGGGSVPGLVSDFEQTKWGDGERERHDGRTEVSVKEIDDMA